MEALAPVIDLLSRMLQRPAGRRALLGDAPDHSGKLLILLQTMKEYHPTAANGGLAAAGRAMIAHYFLSRAAETMPPDAHAALAYATCMAAHGLRNDDGERAVQVLRSETMRLALRLGWRAGGGGERGASAASAPQQQRQREEDDLIDVVPKMNAVQVCACAHCGVEQPAGGPAFQKCSRCRVTPYCSKECQLVHWKQAHKRACVPATPR
jgi:hypothetical protein